MKILAALVVGVGAHAAFGQGGPDPFAHPLPAPRGYVLERTFDSGPQSNTGTTERVVWSTVISTPQASWTRLRFGGCVLPVGSFVRVSSMKDGQVHALAEAALFEWNHSTAYFNGAEVLLELVAGPGTDGNRVTVSGVEVEVVMAGTDGDPGLCGICNGDNRVTSTQPGVARVMPVGCSAALYTPWGCMMSAGHCGGPDMQVMQFNVPASNTNCTLNMPPVDDQFPVLRKAGGGPFEPGSDWNVSVTGRNPSGQTAYQKYGVYLPLATQRAVALNAVDVYGYGFNTACTMNQALQRSPGGGITSTPPATTYYYTYNSDVREGSSGSPLMRLGRIIGVVTHCTDNCPPNYATNIDLPVFAQTRASFCPCPADFNVDGVADFFDYLDFVDAFSAGLPSADFNGDLVIDFFDYLDFVDTFSTGC